MTAPAPKKHVPVARAAWTCYSNFVTCCPDEYGKEHLLKLYESGYRGDMRRLSGHGFLECRQCQPSSYFLAVYSTTPTPIVTCYAICKEDYDTWVNDPSAETLPTPEMLYRLRDPDGRSYNPYWRPPKS